MSYLKKKIRGVSVSLHRYVWEQANGPIPEGFIVHHVNHDKRDNRLENLKLMTHAEHSAHHNQRHPLVKVCEVCSTEYTPSPTKRSRSKTCSEECRRTLLAEQQAKRHGIHLLKCAKCDTPFRVPPSRASKAKFCSTACANRRI